MIDLVISNEPDSELSSMLDQASHKDLRASLLMISPSYGDPLGWFERKKFMA